MKSTRLLLRFFYLLVCNFLWTSLWAVGASSPVSYEGAHVLRVHTNNSTQLSLLSNVTRSFNNGRDLDIWMAIMASPPLGVFDIMVKRADEFRLKERLASGKLRFVTLTADVQRLIDEGKQTSLSPALPIIAWAAYPTFDQITEWMHTLAQSRPFVTVQEIGKSSEGKPLLVLSIASQRRASWKIRKRRKIWIDAGSNAREWLGTASVLYLVYELVVFYERNSDLVDAYEWYIMPVANPDGYVYSHTKDRLWTKTRTNYLAGNNTDEAACRGADPNRNWNHRFWETGLSDLSSTDACRRSYRGPRPFSEPSTSAIQDFLKLMNSERPFLVFLTISSYAGMWMRPWSYTAESQPHDTDELDRAAKLAVNGMQAVNGRNYGIAPASVLRNLADCIDDTCLHGINGGSPIDWALAELHVPYAYQIGLQTGMNGTKGFLAPPDEIAPAGRELLAGVRSLAMDLADDASFHHPKLDKKKKKKKRGNGHWRRAFG